MAKQSYLDISKLDYKRLVRRKDVKALSGGFTTDEIWHTETLRTYKERYERYQLVTERLQKRSELLIWILIDWGYHPDNHSEVNQVLLDLGVWTPMAF